MKGKKMARHYIKTEVLRRFAKIPTFFEPTTPEDIKKEISVIRLEIKDGKQFVVATNQQIAAVEFISVTDSPDDVCYLKLSDSLKNYLAEQKDGDFIVDTIPELAMATASADGYEDYEPCLWFDENIMDSWRSWFGKPIIKHSNDPMVWDLYHVETLFESSPSGSIVFPAFIDPHKPMVLRDHDKDNWCGVFIPDDKHYQNVEPAELPEWMK